MMAFGIRHSAFGIRHSAFGIRHSAFGIRHSAFGIRQEMLTRTGGQSPTGRRVVVRGYNRRKPIRERSPSAQRE